MPEFLNAATVSDMSSVRRTSAVLISNWSSYVANPSEHMAIVHAVDWSKYRVTLEELDVLPSGKVGLTGYGVYLAETEDPDRYTVLTMPDSYWCRYLGPNKTRKIRHGNLVGELAVSQNEFHVCCVPGTDTVPDPMSVSSQLAAGDPPPGIFPSYGGAMSKATLSGVSLFLEPKIGGMVFEGSLASLGAEVHGKQFQVSGPVGHFI